MRLMVFLLKIFPKLLLRKDVQIDSNSTSKHTDRVKMINPKYYITLKYPNFQWPTVPFKLIIKIPTVK